MALSMLKSKRGTKVLDDKKHVKTIPTKYAPVFEKVNSKMTFDKKRLNPDERNTLEIQLHYKKWLEKLSSNERHLFELLKNATPIAARRVHSHSGERLEIVLDNGMKIKSTSVRFFNLFPKPVLVFQNF
jgi:hypothetical protein